MNSIKYKKYKQGYFIEKEKHLYPFYCYKCLSFHSYSLKYNNYKGELYPDCPFIKYPISLGKFLDFGLSLFANEIQCKKCYVKFLSNPKINFNYCKESKSYICSYCLNNNSNNNKNNFIFSLKDLCFSCIEHNKKYQYYCTFCNKNLCADCYINHKKHEYILSLNYLDIKKYNKYIQKPEHGSRPNNKYLEIIKNHLKELPEDKKDNIDFFKTKLCENERDLNIFAETNFLLYLIVLKLYFKYVKYYNNKIIPFEVENNLNFFFQYEAFYIFRDKNKDDIYDKIRSTRHLTEDEESFFSYSDINSEYCIPSFNAIKNINIENYFKDIQKLELKKHICDFEKFYVKLLPKNNLLFIYIFFFLGRVEDDDYYDDVPDEEFNYLVKINNYEEIMDNKLENIIDICEYKINILIGIDKKHIKILNLQKNKIFVVDKLKYSEHRLTKIDILPNYKIIVINYQNILILSIANDNKLIIEKELVFNCDKIEKIIIFPDLNEFVFLKTYGILTDKKSDSKCNLIFKNCDTFQDISNLVLNLKNDIISLIELNNKVICGINNNEVFIINSKTKKILKRECYDFNFCEIYKLSETKIICSLKPEINYRRYMKISQYTIFDYNINENKIHYNSMIDFSERIYSESIFTLKKEAIFVHLKDTIVFKKLLLLNDN